MTNNSKLKPCPFCGGEAKIALLLGRWCVACTECPGAVIRTYADKKEDTIWFWNRRAEAIAKSEPMQGLAQTDTEQEKGQRQ